MAVTFPNWFPVKREGPDMEERTPNPSPASKLLFAGLPSGTPNPFVVPLLFLATAGFYLATKNANAAKQAEFVVSEAVPNIKALPEFITKDLIGLKWVGSGHGMIHEHQLQKLLTFQVNHTDPALMKVWSEAVDNIPYSKAISSTDGLTEVTIRGGYQKVEGGWSFVLDYRRCVKDGIDSKAINVETVRKAIPIDETNRKLGLQALLTQPKVLKSEETLVTVTRNIGDATEPIEIRVSALNPQNVFGDLITHTGVPVRTFKQNAIEDWGVFLEDQTEIVSLLERFNQKVVAPRSSARLEFLSKILRRPFYREKSGRAVISLGESELVPWAHSVKIAPRKVSRHAPNEFKAKALETVLPKRRSVVIVHEYDVDDKYTRVILTLRAKSVGSAGAQPKSDPRNTWIPKDIMDVAYNALQWPA